ncbi:MFS transporter [Streptomyces sp. LHD-70]|uniref:MFS transporter n=1 Tax=Streptomyces sp. LHD-70 TaxID=3072140 RepID=UPI00280F337D|nr:MFS transporter [Streptomyces sp. LHD-70]MDQ8707262.1 MFS transporter [Streptomyces sp. LHD-70]
MTADHEKQATPAPFAATVVMMSVVAALVVGQTFVTIPLMPELAGAWGVPQGSVAWTTSAFAIAYACGSLASGPLSQRYGTRAVLTGCVAALAVATALVPLAPDLTWASALRALQGVVAGSFVPMSYAYLGERVPQHRLPLALTTVNCAASSTVVTGQLLGQVVGSALGWRAVFLVCAPLLAVGALAVRKVMLPDPPRAPRTSATAAGGGARVLVSSRLLPLYVVTLPLVGSLTTIYTAVQLYGPAELVGDSGAMLSLRASALPAMVVAVLLAPLLGRIPALPRAALSLVVAAGGLAATASTGDSTLALGAALFVFVLAISTVGPAVVQAIGASAGAARGIAIAVYGFVLNLGSGIGAQLPLAIEDLGSVALITAGFLAVCVLLVTFAHRSAKRRRGRHAGARHTGVRHPAGRPAGRHASGRRRTGATPVEPRSGPQQPGPDQGDFPYDGYGYDVPGDPWYADTGHVPGHADSGYAVPGHAERGYAWPAYPVPAYSGPEYLGPENAAPGDGFDYFSRSAPGTGRYDDGRSAPAYATDQADSDFAYPVPSHPGTPHADATYPEPAYRGPAHPGPAHPQQAPPRARTGARP